MRQGKRTAPQDRTRVVELASQGLSLRQIAERLGISSATTKNILAKELRRCDRCARAIARGSLCSVCSLPTQAPLGERLKAFRTAAGLSQERLALTIRTHQMALLDWEKGRRQPTQHQLQRLAEALGITVQELTGMP